ncbi:hypothetical protein ACFL6C_06835, partial [Myxococcota bacterium]
MGSRLAGTVLPRLPGTVLPVLSVLSVGSRLPGTVLPVLSLLSLLSLLSALPARGAPNDLTCHYGSMDVPPEETWTAISGDDVSVEVGISDLFGGVAVRLSLINNATPASKVNVLEARSAAGAGWQTSYLGGVPAGGPLLDDDIIAVFNQAAGNVAGYQWGFDNDYLVSVNGIAALEWNTLASDHYHPNRDFGTTVAQSPCGDVTGSYIFDDGKLLLGMATIATLHGAAIGMTNIYSLRAQVDQFWTDYAVEQAFYLSKQVASMGVLRVYLRGLSGWYEGPITPAEDYAIAHARGACDPVDESCAYQIDADLAYAVFVWNIMGLDVGVAINMPTDPIVTDWVRAHLNMVKSIYCLDTTDHSCGSIDWHTVITHSITTTTFAAGETREYAVAYYVGTLEQL